MYFSQFYSEKKGKKKLGIPNVFTLSVKSSLIVMRAIEYSENKGWRNAGF